MNTMMKNFLIELVQVIMGTLILMTCIFILIGVPTWVISSIDNTTIRIDSPITACTILQLNEKDMGGKFHTIRSVVDFRCGDKIVSVITSQLPVSLFDGKTELVRYHVTSWLSDRWWTDTRNIGDTTWKPTKY